MREGSLGDVDWRSRDARLFLLCGALAAIVILVVVPSRILDNGYLTYVSGAWATLADDVSHGLLYRPLVSDLGYGGTRYFPLHIVLHGLLHSMGLSLVAAGHLISLLSAVGIVVGGAVGLQRQGVPRAIAWSTGVLALASRTAFVGIAGIRGDILPVALGVMGLAFLPRSKDEPMRASVVLLALAMLAKPTLAWAPAAAVLCLGWSLRFRQALLLGVGVAVLVFAGLFATYFASHGEFLVSFRALATAGGLSSEYILGALRLMRPGEATWILCGAAVALVSGWRPLATPFGAALPMCAAATAVLYLSPGLHVNHFVDLVVVATLRLGAGVWELWPRRWPRALFAVAAVIGILEAVALPGMSIKRGDFDALLQALPKGPQPMLSETPWVPVLAGERPYAMDAFSLAVGRSISKDMYPGLIEKVDSCAFRVIVLNGPAEHYQYWYDVAAFGTPFREHLLANYVFNGVVGGHAIYLPNCGKPAPPMDVAAEQGEQDSVNRRGEQPNQLKIYLQRILRFAQ